MVAGPGLAAGVVGAEGLLDRPIVEDVLEQRIERAEVVLVRDRRVVARRADGVAGGIGVAAVSAAGVTFALAMALRAAGLGTPLASLVALLAASGPLFAWQAGSPLGGAPASLVSALLLWRFVRYRGRAHMTWFPVGVAMVAVTVLLFFGLTTLVPQWLGWWPASETLRLVPGLAVVLVGEDPASQLYVRNKEKACREVGIKSFEHLLPATVSERELLGLVQQLNKDKSVHGILVQLPLPAHIRAEKILESISPNKDIDGFHPFNQGMLVLGADGFKPCTPMGIMKLLESVNCDPKGKNAVVVGRSNIVGKPVALMLLAKHATVTICHSRTASLRDEVGRGEILVVAIGKPGIVRGEWVKAGAVVIDVGMNRLPNGKLSGDIEYETAAQRASAITPVPGGVGPMTICMLLYNTLRAAKNSLLRER